MSTEQTQGRTVDRRCDIVAFGCVIFECLSGEPAFPGTSVRAVIEAVRMEEPAWSHLPSETPAPIRVLIQRCLEKDLGRRLCDIGDARLEIEQALRGKSDARRPDAGPEVAPNNLPVEMTSFVGRGETIERPCSVIGSNRLLTLTGVGGCGKTRLGLSVTRRSP